MFDLLVDIVRGTLIVVSLGLLLVGLGFLTIAMMHRRLEHAKRLAALVFSFALSILAIFTLGVAYKGWQLAFEGALIVGVILGIAYLAQVLYMYFIEPPIDRFVSRSQNPVLKWLRDPKRGILRRVFFYFDDSEEGKK